MKKVRIHSDGFGMDAIIIDEDGSKLEGVVSADIYIVAGEANKVNLEVIAPGVNVAAHVDHVSFVCPVCEEALVHDCGGGTLGGASTGSVLSP